MYRSRVSLLRRLGTLVLSGGEVVRTPGCTRNALSLGSKPQFPSVTRLAVSAFTICWAATGMTVPGPKTPIAPAL